MILNTRSVRYTHATVSKSVSIQSIWNPFSSSCCCHPKFDSSRHYFHEQSHRRCFSAVKELPWCAPTDSPNRRIQNRKKQTQQDTTADETKEKFIPIERFGIVAASSKDGIIGVNAGLPWRIPKDRDNFANITRNKIFILGRNSLQELPGNRRENIEHTAHTIVISKTLGRDGDEGAKGAHVARTFPEALHIARQLAQKRTTNKNDDNTMINTKVSDEQEEKQEDLDCWIGGGERIYDEALEHPSAERLHLTIVDVDFTKGENATGINGLKNIDIKTDQIARFPAKYRWDHKFKLISKQEVTDESTGIDLTEYIYQRIRRKR